jgi:hypothetical protein
MTQVNGWLYLIQRGDHRKSEEEIYKIGGTNDFNRRINEYPIASQIISVCPVDNEKRCERELIKEFKSEFDYRNDIGLEYFEDNERDMRGYFHDYCSDPLPNREDEIDIDYHWEIEKNRLNNERNQKRFKKKY